MTKKQPYTQNGLWMLHSWHKTGNGYGSAHLIFSEQAFFQMPPNNWKDSSEKMTLPQSSAFHLLQNISLSLMFLLERSGFFVALLDTTPSSKSLRHCVCRCTHTCLLPFLSNLCTGGGLIPQLKHLQETVPALACAPWSSLATIEPLSLKFLIIQ